MHKIFNTNTRLFIDGIEDLRKTTGNKILTELKQLGLSSHSLKLIKEEIDKKSLDATIATKHMNYQDIRKPYDNYKAFLDGIVTIQKQKISELESYLNSINPSEPSVSPSCALL